MSSPRRPDPEQVVEAVGYVRVSRKMQADGYSPETQREQIRQLAKKHGFLLDPANIFEDHERGAKITRRGYQEVINRVRAGTAHAVLCFMFDRFGRDGAEWLARAREFERLGVPIISAQEGTDEPGILRFVRVGMAEQFSRDLAKKVRPNREAAARGGTHMGQTPYGYLRVYPERHHAGRPPAGQLVPDERPDGGGKAWVVRDLFTRYAAGGESTRSLAQWCNTDPRVGPAPMRALWEQRHPGEDPPPRTPVEWTAVSVRRILRNPAYRGAIRFNQQPHVT
jgi:DNA invertase Pin-like site-specific DNA recombinase